MDKITSGQKEAAFARLEKATNEELEQVSAHILGYNAFQMDAKKYIFPSTTRARILKILRHKIETGQISFEKNE